MADKLELEDVREVHRRSSRLQTRAVSRLTAAKDPKDQHKLRDTRQRRLPPRPQPIKPASKDSDDDTGSHTSGHENTEDDTDDGNDDDNKEGSSGKDDESENEKIIVPKALGNESAVTGQEVFGFQTPRRAGSLAAAASEAIHLTAKTPKSAKSIKGKTPKSATQGKANARKRNQENHASAKDLSPDKTKRSKPSTPHQGKRIALRVPDGSEEEYSDGSSDEDAQPYKRSETDNPEEIIQEYFAVHHSTKCLTSDRTLASLGVPLMDQEELSEHLQQVSATHQDECVKLYAKYRSFFSKWVFQIRHGFNLLFYGMGSKKVLMDQFRSSMLQGLTQLVVNGFFPSITIKQILNTITEEVLEHDGAFRSVIDQTTFIRDMFNKGKAPGSLYLIIHNIDGPMLRSKKTQTILSLLAESPLIHIIASIDHINAPLVWDQSMCSRFKWLWNDVSTFEPYVEETSYENSLLVQQSGALALSSMAHVMRSLTPNGQGIFLVIVKKQLEEKDNSSYIGIAMHDLYTACRERFLVNSEQTLRAQLTEFRDHKLIRSRKGADGVEHLHIPLDTATLKQFLEEQEQNR